MWLGVFLTRAGITQVKFSMMAILRPSWDEVQGQRGVPEFVIRNPLAALTAVLVLDVVHNYTGHVSPSG